MHRFVAATAGLEATSPLDNLNLYSVRSSSALVVIPVHGTLPAVTISTSTATTADVTSSGASGSSPGISMARKRSDVTVSAPTTPSARAARSGSATCTSTERQRTRVRRLFVSRGKCEDDPAGFDRRQP